MNKEPLSLDLFDDSGEGLPADAPVRSPPQDDLVDSPTIWSVSQVNRAARDMLERALPPLWVSGEVGGWKRARSGHCYFTLKDARAQLRCVLFRSDAQRLPIDPDEGAEVRVFGSLTLYELRGEYQLVARRLEGMGEEGLWRLAFEKLRAKLQEEGLLDPARKRPIPRFPTRVGVVTSATGAALEDILTVLRRRAPWTTVVLRDTRVQGEGASEEIAGAIRRLAAEGDVDVMIVGRGGGSVEDLWAFNEEPVARAIADCSVPVISAVGHEVDVTISDLVADFRAPTPSAAAEAAVQDGDTVLAVLRKLPERLVRGLQASVLRRRRRVVDGGARLRDAFVRLLAPRRQRLDRSSDGLERAIKGIFQARRRRFDTLTGKIEALSPLATIHRGYAVPLGGDGRLLRAVRDFEVGGAFTLRVSDGRVECETVDVSGDEVALND